jgi:hypothetical protein
MEKKKSPRNAMLGWIQQNDPTRLKDRTVKPEKGKGKKDRPRENKVDDCFDKAA